MKRPRRLLPGTEARLPWHCSMWIMALVVAFPPEASAFVVTKSERRVPRESILCANNNNKNLGPSEEEEDSLVDEESDGLELWNDFYALRHGQSLANVQGVIASNPEIACHEYGLSEVGRDQARQAGRDIVQTFLKAPPYSGLVLLSSDFLRARETAEAVLKVVEDALVPVWSCTNKDDKDDYNNNTKDKVVLVPFLRERWFGDWDGTSDNNYHCVWKNDALDATHTEGKVESVASVLHRVCAGLQEYDNLLQSQLQHEQVKHCDRSKKYMVAHGDILQILQTAFAGIDGRLHRSLPHLETATLRALNVVAP